MVDANEAWTEATIEANLAACEKAGVELVEQPLPAGRDEALVALRRRIAICADESFHGLDSLDEVARRYDAINVKLDKTGGLTPALAVARAARLRSMPVMVGCMLGTSLAMAPAMLIAASAKFVDLDGPLLLARDREPALAFEGSTVHPAGPELWG